MNNATYQIGGSDRPILPPYDEFVGQMSPFGDDRWDLDEEENRRRKEIHREYVYNYRRPIPDPPIPQEQMLIHPEESKSVPVISPRVHAEEPEKKTFEIPILEPEIEPEKKDYFKFERTQPKSLSEIQFETPKPPNLYPVLKFPAKRIDKDSVYRLANDTVFVPQKLSQNETFELPPKPQFSEYKDITFEKRVFHYGVNVPFWQFPKKSNAS